MGTLIILIGGFIGASSAARKPFLVSWVFLVNLCLSVYIGLFASPLIVPMLEIPGLDSGYKIAISVYGMLFVSMIVLYKAVDSIFPNREVALNLPLTAEKIGTLVAGFFAGSMVVTLILYCYCLCPFSAHIESPAREPLKVASGKSILRMIRVVNAFSFQSISTEGERYLQVLGVMPPPPPPVPRPPRKAAPANNIAAPAAPADGKTALAKPDGGVPPAIPAHQNAPSAPANGQQAPPADGKTASGMTTAGTIPDTVQKKPSPKTDAEQANAPKNNQGLSETLKQRKQSEKSILEDNPAANNASAKPAARGSSGNPAAAKTSTAAVPSVP